MDHGDLIDNWTVNMSTNTTASDEGVSPAQLAYLSLLILFGAEFVIALIVFFPWFVSPRTPMGSLVFFPLDD
jgi:hypothetical protein